MTNLTPPERFINSGQISRRNFIRNVMETVCVLPAICVCVCVWGGGVHSPQRTSNTGFGVFFDFTQNKNISQATMNPILYDTMIEITVTSSWPLRSPAHRLHVQRYVHINQNANIKTPHGCSLVRWIQRDLYQRHILKENRYHCHKKGSNIIWVSQMVNFKMHTFSYLVSCTSICLSMYIRVLQGPRAKQQETLFRVGHWNIMIRFSGASGDSALARQSLMTFSPA